MLYVGGEWMIGVKCVADICEAGGGAMVRGELVVVRIITGSSGRYCTMHGGWRGEGKVM